MSSESIDRSHVNSSQCHSDEQKSNDIRLSESDQTDNNLIIKSTDCSIVGSSLKIDQHRFGWLNFYPKCFQTFLSAKWALFWMCWAGALQGIRTLEN